MKLDARQVEAFLDAPGACRVVLLYGEDVGLIRERASRLVWALAGAVDDPFRVTELEKDGYGRIAEELASQALGGGRRVVRVRDVGDAVLATVQSALSRPGDALLVLEAPGLPARGKLRGAMERAPDAAAIACYAQEGRVLEQAIMGLFAAFRVSVDPDAREWLVAQLGADQAVTRREIEKLALYAGDGGRVNLADARLCVGDLAGLSLDDALFAATAGNAPAADRALELAIAEGSTAVGVLRSALLHLQRLQQAKAAMADGASAVDAAKRARPPVFFRREAAFVRALGLWSERDLQAACQRVWEAERACKRTGSPAETISRSAILGLAQRAAAARR